MSRRFDLISLNAGLLLFLLLSESGSGATAAEGASPDWGFNALVGWSWRDIDGTVFSVNPPLAGAGTADSLGLGSSSEPQAGFGVRWK